MECRTVWRRRCQAVSHRKSCDRLVAFANHRKETGVEQRDVVLMASEIRGDTQLKSASKEPRPTIHHQPGCCEIDMATTPHSPSWTAAAHHSPEHEKATHNPKVDAWNLSLRSRALLPVGETLTRVDGLSARRVLRVIFWFKSRLATKRTVEIPTCLNGSLAPEL